MTSKQEIDVFWGFISRSIDRIIGCLDGISKEDMDWRPINTANSLFVLAVHILGTTEENILGILCGRPVQRQRETEFAAVADSDQDVWSRWRKLRSRIEEGLEQMSPEELNRKKKHPRRGQLTGREVLIVVARHAAEHMGQAMLTRDLLLVEQGKTPPQRVY